jgi:hypothetical protein
MHVLGAEPAGRVLFAAGSPSAIAADGSTRALRKGDAIEEGDLLVTGAGRLQLVFKDHGVVALYPDTHFRVEQYRFTGAGDDSDGVVLRLVKGGLRTISGLVGKRNHSDYRMEARVATIGIRGTEYGLQLGETLVGNVGEGAIDVCNTAGCLRVGISQAFMVPSLTEMPVLAQLQARLPSPAAAQEEAGTQRDEDRGGDKPASTHEGARELGANRGDDASAVRPGQDKRAGESPQAREQPGTSASDDDGKRGSGGKRGKHKYFRDEDIAKRRDLKAAGSDGNRPDTTGPATPTVSVLTQGDSSVPAAAASSASARALGTVAGAPGASAAAVQAGVSAAPANPGVPSAGAPSTAAVAGSAVGTASTLAPGLAKKLTDPLKLPPGLLKKTN